VGKLSEQELRTLLSAAESRQHAREEREDKLIVEAFKSGIVPVPEDIRAILRQRNFSHRKRLMSHHPFWKEWMLRQGFEALYGAAVAARVDVLRHNAALGAFAAGHDQFHEHVDYTVSNPSQKDVLAYCSIAFSVVDNNRRIRKLRPDLEAIFPGLIERHFNNSVTAFVMMLRENLTHGRMVMSNWTISRDENGTAGQMLFDVDDLLLFGKWDAMALEYIKVQPHGRVNIGAAISEHFKHLTEFRREIVDFLARNRRADEIDFFEIEDEHRERGYLVCPLKSGPP
jgi:hypothetical protein